MTIPGWGRLTPLQAHMLNLAGHVLENPDAPPDAKRKAIARGRWELKRQTGQDFGFDIRQWHEYLIEFEEDHYCHPYAWRTVRPAIEASFEDPQRSQLVPMLEQPPEKLGNEGLAVVIVEALIEAGMIPRQELQRAVPVVRDAIKIRKILGKM